MKASELRNKSSEELHQMMNSLLKEQFNLRMQEGLGEMPRPHQFKQNRRAIARLKTLLGEVAMKEKAADK